MTTILIVAAIALGLAWLALITTVALITGGNGHIPEAPERTAGQDGDGLA